jgi:hypothetical protein
MNGVDHLAVDGERAGAADAADVVGIPFSSGLDAVFRHVVALVETLQFPVGWGHAKDVTASERGLRLMPDGAVLTVPEEDAAVVGERAGQLCEAPFDMESEVVEFAVEAEPFVAAVAVAEDGALVGIDVPLRDLADGIGGRDGDARPLRLVVGREQVDGLRGDRQGNGQKGKAEQAETHVREFAGTAKDGNAHRLSSIGAVAALWRIVQGARRIDLLRVFGTYPPPGILGIKSLLSMVYGVGVAAKSSFQRSSPQNLGSKGLMGILGNVREFSHFLNRL